MKRIIPFLLTINIIINFLLFSNYSYATSNSGSESTPRTGHTQKEAADTIAAWCIRFKEKHGSQCIYNVSGRDYTYTLPVSDSDTSTNYVFDCVGFVSFALHHALGIGRDDFTIFASPDIYSPDNVGAGLDVVYKPSSGWEPGDVLIMGHHVAIYVGDGKSIGMYRDQLYYGSAEYDCSANGGYAGYVGRINAQVARNANFAYLQGAGSGGAALQMRGTKIADCAFEHDGVMGDSTGVEWQVKEWMRDGGPYAWDVVYRYPDEKVARMIATLAINAANNDNIGYKFEGWNGGARQNSFGNELEKANYDPSAITAKCDTMCSYSTSNIVRAAGYKLNISSLKAIPKNVTTPEANYPSRGFKAMTDSQFLNGTDNLLAGDLLCCSGKHIVIFVGNGMVGEAAAAYEIDDIVVNLDEQNFDFSGTPKTVIYTGGKKGGEWIFSAISEFIDFIVAVIANGIKMSVLGWSIAIEGVIDGSIKYLEGY